MTDEMLVLESNDMWELVPLLFGKKRFGCRWAYIVKFGSSGEVDCLKVRLVAIGYIQFFAFDYFCTSSLVVNITTIRLFLAMFAIHHWPSLTNITLKMHFSW